MKYLIAFFLISTFLLVSYTDLREILFLSAEKGSSSWQEIYNCILGCFLIFFLIKGFVLLFPPITKVDKFRSLRGFILLSIFCFLGFSFFVRDILFFRFHENFSTVAINTAWSIVGIYSFFKGGYSLLAGNNFHPSIDDGDFKPNLNDFLYNNFPLVSESSISQNSNIQRILEYRESLITMKSNDEALRELAKTSGVEMFLNSDSSYAKFLDSKLAGQSNSAGYNYLTNLFGK